MHDFVESIVKKYEISRIIMPGYIGWSPKEGSGLFDSVKSINGLLVQYYKMNQNLTVDIESYKKLLVADESPCIVLIVNYFGFRDPQYDFLVDEAKSRGNVSLEDNAHGFLTYYLEKKNDC